MVVDKDFPSRAGHHFCYLFTALSLIFSIFSIPVVPHKAVAEVSKIGNLQERLVVVNHGWQSESTDGPTGG